MLVLLVGLAACKNAEQRQGVPGRSGCEPILEDPQCSIWECWVVYDNGVVDYSYAADWDGHSFATRSGPCESPYDCCTEERKITASVCPGAAVLQAYCQGST